MLSVEPVTDSSGWEAFTQIPHRVYRDDPHWIADETVDLARTLINPDQAARKRAETQAFVAYGDTGPVGRIVAIADHRYNAHRADPAAFFGFYEATAYDAVTFALLDAVAAWARQRSMTRLYGPFNPSMAHSAGLLISGGARPPLVGMPHNPAYYADHVVGWGMRKAKDLHSYLVPVPRPRRPPQQRPGGWQPLAGLTFRTMDPHRFAEEIETVRTIYNDAFVDFWGFTPVDPVEFRDLADGFRPVLDSELVVFAEVDGRPVGYLMAFPDPGQDRHARIDMLAVHPDHQDTWIGGMLIFEMLRRIHRKGYASAEAAPILEDATWPRSLRGALTLSRVYRVFGRELGPAR